MLPETAFLKVVEAALAHIPVPVYEARQDHPVEIKPYAVVDFLAARPGSMPYIGGIDTEGVRTIYGSGSGTLSVDVHGLNAVAIATALPLMLSGNAAQELADRYNVSIGDTISVVNTSGQIDRQYEERGTSEFHVMFTQEFVENVGRIETTRIQSLPDGSVIVSTSDRSP